MAKLAASPPAARTDSHDNNGQERRGRSMDIVASAMRLGAPDQLVDAARPRDGYFGLDTANDASDKPSRAAEQRPDAAAPQTSTNGAIPQITTTTSTMSNMAQEAKANTIETIPTRRSIQFSEDTFDLPVIPTSHESPSPSRPTASHQRHGSNLLSRIRALAPSTSTSQGRGGNASDEPASGGDWVDEADADAETSGPEDTPATTRRQARKQRKRRRFFADGTQISPLALASRASRPAAAGTEDTTRPAARGQTTTRSSMFHRSSSIGELPQDRVGVSEDEGRARLARVPAWRRRSSNWFSNLPSAMDGEAQDDETEPPTPGGTKAGRPGNLKRLSQLAGNSYSGDNNGASNSPWHLRTDAGQRRWRQLKAGLKMLGQKRKVETRIDYVKSAELVAELLAGSPAAVIMASHFQRDEHEKRKVPILLEQVRVSVTESVRRDDTAGDRHANFRLDCEYFSGRMHMQWTVWRSLYDFLQLHSRFKLQSTAANLKTWRGDDAAAAARTKMPHFPKGAFPFLRASKTLEDEEDDDGGAGPGDDGALTTTTPTVATTPLDARSPDTPTLPPLPPPEDSSPAQSPAPAARPSPFRLHTRRASTNLARLADGRKQDAYAARQRKKLETYIREMMRYQMFRAGSNRICKFLELSTISVRMAIDGTYKGKEGTLSIQRTTGMDSRRKRAAAVFTKARPMWFLVRQSYLFCVDSVDDSRVYDVFLVDADFSLQAKRPRLRDQSTARDLAKTAKHSAAHPTHSVLRLQNSERKVKLLAKNERQLVQFEDSIRHMVAHTEWAARKRFDSFAPVRRNVFASWIVDARDYFWNVSRGIAMAKHVIYIHDWWLSPELYLRRPPAANEAWRLDRLLQRKAAEGVKIYVMVYRNIDSAIPIDSQHTKALLLDLHPNIFVQRSPNQIRQKSFFWAHHEKMCVVDYNLAFCGGVDLCFGRFDAPGHVLGDDKPAAVGHVEQPPPSPSSRGPQDTQTWPGKDYSNPRVQDFYELTEPFDDMYDRSRVPRMPWHDIAMQTTGQPARDLARHFVQRWNFILRQRTPSRPTPFLIPPPDFTDAQLAQLGLRGTCDVQMLRSCTEWSIGTQGRTEHSIMNAYVHLIDRSEHFVYIENQFFITSTLVENSRIHNLIGDALVERIVRAHRNGDRWKAVIVIPLMPGFQSTVDATDGSSVRLIMQCQYRSICRGEHSILQRLKNAGIRGQDYISFYSLRQWGKIGPQKALVTEQLYIHAKCMIVDDRSAIIGSANINERSMLGSRDSELACLVRDTDFIDSHMAGQPYRVGRFPHTLRMRLMREHLGIDVDGMSVGEDPRAADSASEGKPGGSQSRVHRDAMRDPLDDAFVRQWRDIARDNTEVYRQVFRCMPDDNVRSWREYEEYMAYSDRFAQAQGLGKSSMRMQQEAKGASGPPGAGSSKMPGSAHAHEHYVEDHLSEHSEPTVIEKSIAESLLDKVTGHLVTWPLRWLEEEERGGKWLFSLDQMQPLEIYN